MDVNREKAIDLAVSQIEKQFGKGAIMKLGEGGIVKDVQTISTGSLGSNRARHRRRATRPRHRDLRP